MYVHNTINKHAYQYNRRCSDPLDDNDRNTEKHANHLITHTDNLTGRRSTDTNHNPTYRRLDVMVADDVNWTRSFDQLEGDFVIVLQSQIQISGIEALAESEGAQHVAYFIALWKIDKLN